MYKIISGNWFFRALCGDGCGYCSLIKLGKGKNSFNCFKVSAKVNSRFWVGFFVRFFVVVFFKMRDEQT